MNEDDYTDKYIRGALCKHYICAAFPTLDPDAPSSIFSHLGRPLGRRSRHFIDRSRQNKLIHDTQLSISLLGDPLTRWGQEEA